MKVFFFITVLFSFNTLISQNLHPDFYVKKINVKTQQLDSVKTWDAINNYKIENFSSENTLLKTYIKDKEILKMVFEVDYSNSKQVSNYYFEDNVLMYAFEKEIEYNASILSDNFDPLLNTTIEYKSYFNENQLVRQLDSSDAGCLFSREYLIAAGSSIIDEAEVLKSLIASGSKN